MQTKVISSLSELAGYGYFITRGFRDDFYKLRKRGRVYLHERDMMLGTKQKLSIPVKKRSDFALDWNEYLAELKQFDEQKSH